MKQVGDLPLSSSSLPLLEVCELPGFSQKIIGVTILIQNLTPLRGCRSLLEIVCVGQCEVFVCLGFGHFILFVYFFPWPRSS